jgi:hypothetical protein
LQGKQHTLGKNAVCYFKHDNDSKSNNDIDAENGKDKKDKYQKNKRGRIMNAQTSLCTKHTTL